MIATIATVCLTASTANINHESRAPTVAQGMGMGLRVPGAEPTQLPSAINLFGMPASLTGMEGEGEGGGMGYKTMGYRRMLRGSI